MAVRRIAGVLVLVLFGLVSSASAITVAIVEDGKALRHETGFVRVKDEIRSLVGGEFEVDFVTMEAAASGPDGIRARLRKAFGQRDVDVVLCLGIVSSHVAARLPVIPKPVIAAIILDTELQKIPRTGGASGVANLSYVESFQGFRQEVSAFFRLKPFSHVVVLGDALLVEGIPELASGMARVAQERGISIDFVPVRDVDTTLSALPEGADAVMLGPLFGLSPEAFLRLAEGLHRKKLPTFSFWGREDVEHGILAATAPESRTQRLSRRVALNLQQILLGTPAGALPVAFEPKSRLVVNLDTARRIGLSPDRQVLLSAERIGGAVLPTDTLSAVVAEAVTRNLEFRLSEFDVRLEALATKRARARLLPHVAGGVASRFLDSDSAEGSMSRRAERDVGLLLRVSETLFSDADLSLVAIGRLKEAAAGEARNAIRLDVGRQAARLYLDLLSVTRLAAIREDDLALTMANLDRAESRKAVGYSGPSDVYRWEAELASARRNLLDARARVRQAELALKRLLFRTSNVSLLPEDIRLDAPDLVTNHPTLKRLSNNANQLEILTAFLVEEALQRAPELRQLDLGIRAEERAIRAARRRFFVPTLVAEGGLRHLFDRSGAGSEATRLTVAPGMPSVVFDPSDDLSWQAELRLELPLATGGELDAVLREARTRKARLLMERQRLVLGLSTRMRQAMAGVAASWPGIGLAEDAARAARRNRELVVDAYERGVVPVIDLVDAQHAARVAEEQAATSRYAFLKDLVDVNRLLGIEGLSVSDEREARMQRMERFFEERAAAIAAEKEAS